MTLPELEPIEFRPYPVVETFKHFEKKVNGYSEIFSDISDVEGYVEKFINKYPKFKKPFKTKEFAAKEVQFELRPLIAEFSSSLKSLPHEIKLVDKLKHVALRPKDAVEGVYYHCDMYVPIPDDMLNIDSEEKLLKEHFNMMASYIDKEFRQNIYELKPQGIVTRMCGWDGSWIVYSYSIKDDPSVVWSTPLVDSPYNSTQPFLSVNGGEFVILEDDCDPENHKRVKDVRNRLEYRIKDIDGLELKAQKAIQVNMEWVIAHAISTKEIFQVLPLEVAVKNFGEHIPDLTIHMENLKGDDLLQFMEKEIIKEPTYRFTLENIKKNTFQNK